MKQRDRRSAVKILQMILPIKKGTKYVPNRNMISKKKEESV
jgi:hypothetical protein